jgi:hypothetical protein
MDDPRTEIEQKESLLAELEARLQALERIKRELSAQAQILRHQLAELKKAGNGTAPVSGKERRSSPRRQGNLVSVTIIQEVSKEESSTASAPGDVPEGNSCAEKGPAHPSSLASRPSPMTGWVLNRSGGGLCLLVDDEVTPGTVLTVTPNIGPASFEWIQVEVKSCRPERQSWHLGCQFLQKLCWDDLRPFG